MNSRKAVKKLMPKKLFKQVAPYGHLAETIVLQTKNNFPAKNLVVIGVTGTNGKTTTAFMIHNMLTKAGLRTGLMTTVAYGVGNNLTPQIAHMTTVSPKLLLKRIASMEQQGIDYLVLETTSHALAQFRVWGIKYSIAVLTNLTHEHLDYHGTFHNYQQAKLRMFKMANANKRGLQLGIINSDDPSFKVFAKPIKNVLDYGINSGKLRAENIKLTPSKISYNAYIENDRYDIECNIPGSFNVYNSLAAVAVGRALELSKEQIEQGVSSLDGVEGRMTKVSAGQKFTVIIDFAHTPDSFEKLFADLKPVVKGRLIALFGSAGRRDEAKRAIQGEIAGKYADIVVVTEEDDRDVNGNEIMEQIASGAKKSGKKLNENLHLILDREEAIKFALTTAQAEDTVILLGKGHEKTIERADGEHAWNEIEITKNILKTL